MEQALEELEMKFYNFYQKQKPRPFCTYCYYFRKIIDLCERMLGATIGNSRSILQVDSVYLAAHNFWNKL